MTIRKAQATPKARALSAEQVQALIDKCRLASDIAQQANAGPFVQAYSNLITWIEEIAGGPQPTEKRADPEWLLQITKIAEGRRF